MKLPRRRCLHLAAVVAVLPIISRSAWAQTYPKRPVRLTVSVPAGGSPDIVARLLGQWLSERLGQQIVIDNRPGGSANIGTEDRWVEVRVSDGLQRKLLRDECLAKYASG